MSLGKNLKVLRKNKGCTQQELAVLTGIKIAHISKLENDEGDPKLSTIQKLIDALECSPNDLLWTPETSSLSSMLRTYVERAFSLPANEKVLLLKVIERFLLADSLRAVEQATIPEAILEDVLEDQRQIEDESEDQLRKMAEEEGKKELPDREGIREIKDGTRLIPGKTRMIKLNRQNS